jgi:hypothetical protein
LRQDSHDAVVGGEGEIPVAERHLRRDHGIGWQDADDPLPLPRSALDETSAGLVEIRVVAATEVLDYESRVHALLNIWKYGLTPLEKLESAEIGKTSVVTAAFVEKLATPQRPPDVRLLLPMIPG